jgi:signal transduction histidine kinase
VNTSTVFGGPSPAGFGIVDFREPEPDRPPQSSVLIVDDDPADRMALRNILEPLGHCIVTATSGSEARRCVTERDFAVILLDIRASSVDGFETAAFIRTREASRLTPIIFLTAIDRTEQELTIGYAMGAVDFVVAPVVPAVLRGKVSLFAELFAKNLELVESARRLRLAARRASDALAMQRVMVDRMEELGRTKSDFVSRVSHELRSPLTSVIGYVELLIDGAPGTPTDDQGRMLEIIDRNSRRLLALIEDLLTMSRVEAGLFELHVGPVDLAAVVTSVRETTAPAFAQAELVLTVELGDDLQLTGDREQLERALLNLVSNSVKFTAPRGRVSITAQVCADEIVVSVRDTGAGIALEEQEHLFTRFFRATRSQEQEVPGTGLGLYIVKQIVELHGGTMEVFSTDQGSAFTMHLPNGGPPAA